jgi:hypothetical protein
VSTPEPLTFVLAPGRLTVLFEPGELDPVDLIAAVTAAAREGARS